MAHDFITPQPIHGADVYIFRWIFHNWSDKYCVRILKNLIPALKPGAKIVVNDTVLPQPGVLSNWQESRIRLVLITANPTISETVTGYSNAIYPLATPMKDLSVIVC